MKIKIILISLLFFILLLSFCSALTLGISPEKIKLSGEINKEICGNFSIIGNENSLFLGEVRWSMENSKDINRYVVSSQEIKINAFFPKEASSGKYQICLSSEKAEEYYGILMYKLKDSSYGIGTWIELNIKQEKSVQNILLVTGKIIHSNNLEKIFLFTPFLFLVVLILLLIKLKNKK